MDDDIYEAADPELFVSFSTTIKVVRAVDRRLIPTTFTLKADVIYDDEHSFEDESHYHFHVQVALAKVRYWLHEVAHDSVMFNRENKWAVRAFLNSKGKQSVDNQMIILPGEPTEDVLAEVLQSKMNALAGGHITFGCIELCSDDTDGLTYIFTGEGEMNLPEMDEWIGEHTFFSKPWWARDDASTIDVIPDDKDDLNSPPAFAYSLEFIRDTMKAKNAPTARIVRAEFRPKVLKGGKSE